MADNSHRSSEFCSEAQILRLSDLTPDRLCETAKANFERAKDFDREKLTERRRSFYGEFAKEARDVGA